MLALILIVLKEWPMMSCTSEAIRFLSSSWSVEAADVNKSLLDCIQDVNADTDTESFGEKFSKNSMTDPNFWAKL